MPTGGLSGRPTRRNAKASPINSRTNAFYIPSYEWVVKGGWNIADCVARSYDVEGMHVGTVAAGRIGLAGGGGGPSTGIFTRVSVLISHFVLAKIMITVGLMMMHGRVMTSRAC